METQEILRQLGLTDKETKTYLALVNLGKTTTGAVVQRTGIPSSKIYFILGSLIKKGLVSYSISASRKYYSAQAPDTLGVLLEQKIKELGKLKGELDKTIKEIGELRKKKEEGYEVKVYEGLKGIESVQEEIIRSLSEGDKVLMVGRTKLADESLIGYFKDFHKRRSKKGIIYYVIKNAEAKKSRFIEDFSNTQVRYLPEELNSPTLFQIFKDKVVIMLYEPFSVAFMIENEKVSRSFRAYFEGLWNIAKK